MITFTSGLGRPSVVTLATARTLLETWSLEDSRTASGDTSDMDEDSSRLERLVDPLVDRLLRAGIDGLGPIDSAQAVADAALRDHGSADEAVDAIVKHHTKLAAAGGFVTGVGGFVTLLIALPVNVVGFYIIATRMVAAMAAAHGADLTSPNVRTAVLLALSGDDATDIVRKAGGGAITGHATSFALRQLPPEALMAVNKGVAFQIVVRLGQRTLGSLGRFVPLAGGVIGGSIDAYVLRRIAKHARKVLADMPPREAVTSG